MERPDSLATGPLKRGKFTVIGAAVNDLRRGFSQRCLFPQATVLYHCCVKTIERALDGRVRMNGTGEGQAMTTAGLVAYALENVISAPEGADHPGQESYLERPAPRVYHVAL